MLRLDRVGDCVISEQRSRLSSSSESEVTLPSSSDSLKSFSSSCLREPTISLSLRGLFDEETSRGLRPCFSRAIGEDIVLPSGLNVVTVAALVDTSYEVQEWGCLLNESPLLLLMSEQASKTATCLCSKVLSM